MVANKAYNRIIVLILNGSLTEISDFICLMQLCTACCELPSYMTTMVTKENKHKRVRVSIGRKSVEKVFLDVETTVADPDQDPD